MHCWRNWNLLLLYGSSKHMRGNVSIDGTYLKEKALHIVAHLGMANFSASDGCIDRFKRRPNTVYRILSGESRSVDSETIEGLDK
jgi:hypothetical protein